MQYDFVSPVQWQAYRHGYQDDIRHHREDELIASWIAPLAMAPVFAFVAAIKHAAH
jgi:hypothetical protein